MTAEPANAAELHAAAVECAEAAVAMYEAGETARRLSEEYMTAMTRGQAATEQREALEAAYQAHDAAQFRHRNAVYTYAAIRPTCSAPDCRNPPDGLTWTDETGWEPYCPNHKREALNALRPDKETQ
jgi:hypothetical protein